MSDNGATRTNTTHSPPHAVRIPVPIWTVVLHHLRAGLPLEACGLLGGRRDETGVLTAERWYQGTNVLRSPNRFRMDDREVIHAHVDMRERGLELVGIVHSHPETAPTPSPTDLREAFYREIALIVVSFRAGAPEAAAWTVPAGGQAEAWPLDLAIGPDG
jgi:[CysO sulfur-carrier protein]-S-L-cysteine hydrolase